MAKGKSESVDQELDALMQRINTDAGHRVIARGEDVPNVFFLRRPSGIMQLDIDTGGGLPAGGCCYLSGPEGAGKTYLLCKYMGRHQKLYGHDSRIALATVEFPPDHMYLRKLGMKIAVPDLRIEEEAAYRAARRLPPLTKEEIKDLKTQIGRFDVITGATAEETLGAVLALVGSKKYGIVGVDSISVMLPDSDKDKDLDENAKRAGLANVLTEFLKKYHPKTLSIDYEVNETTLIMISQVRANNRKAEAPSHLQKYIPDYTTTGAYAARHGKLIDITLRTGEKIKKGKGAEAEQVGKMLCWEVVKGKAGCHDGVRGEQEFLFQQTIDEASTVLVAGVQAGVISEHEIKRKKLIEVVRPETGEVLVEGLTRGEFLERLEEDLEFDIFLRREILAAKGIPCRYR